MKLLYIYLQAIGGRRAVGGSQGGWGISTVSAARISLVQHVCLVISLLLSQGIDATVFNDPTGKVHSTRGCGSVRAA